MEREKHETLKINILVECTFVNILAEQCGRALKTRNTPIYRESDLSVIVEQLCRKIVIEMDESEMMKCGWSLFIIDGLCLKINKYKPLWGNSFIPLPNKLKKLEKPASMFRPKTNIVSSCHPLEIRTVNPRSPQQLLQTGT